MLANFISFHFPLYLLFPCSIIALFNFHCDHRSATAPPPFLSHPRPSSFRFLINPAVNALRLSPLWQHLVYLNSSPEHLLSNSLCLSLSVLIHFIVLLTCTKWRKARTRIKAVIAWFIRINLHFRDRSHWFHIWWQGLQCPALLLQFFNVYHLIWSIVFQEWESFPWECRVANASTVVRPNISILSFHFSSAPSLASHVQWKVILSSFLHLNN